MLNRSLKRYQNLWNCFCKQFKTDFCVFYNLDFCGKSLVYILFKSKIHIRCEFGQYRSRSLDAIAGHGHHRHFLKTTCLGPGDP